MSDYPHSLEAEGSVLGAMLLSRQAIEEAVNVVGAQDFYKPANQLVFNAIATMFEEGGSIDAVTVSEWLNERGGEQSELIKIGGPGYLIELMGSTPAVGTAAKYAKIVLDRSNSRRLIAECEATIDSAYNLEDPESLRDALTLSLDVISTPMAEVGSLLSIEEFMKIYEAADHATRWTVDGLLKDLWRCVVVAGEGGGKTTLFRQFALAAAQGVQPFTLAPLAEGKVPTLIGDFENNDDSVYEICRPVTDRLERHFERSRNVGEYEEGQAWLYHRPDGIDIRNPVQFAKLDAVIATVKPKLVCLGPLYKMYAEYPGDGVHTAMKATLAALDKLRVRHGFALMLEHHAPHGAGGSSREMRPEGSSLLLRWPELGLGMTYHKERGQVSETNVELTRWRHDRLRNHWPRYIKREVELTEERMPWRVWEGPSKNPEFQGGRDYDDE